MNAPDLAAKHILQGTLEDLRARPNVLDQILKGASSDDLSEAKDYFAAKAVALRLGWAQTSIVMPCVAITVAQEQEAQQFIGSSFGGVDGDSSFLGEDNSLEEWQAAQFTGALDFAIYDTNATVVSWLAAIVKWALLRNRPVFEELGLVEQRVSVTDFMPASDYPQPESSYTRVVKMQYTTFVTYTTVDETHTPVLAADTIIVRDLSDG